MTADGMNIDKRITGSLVLVGCGKMGSALLSGWLAQGLTPSKAVLVDPYKDPLANFLARGCRYTEQLGGLLHEPAPQVMLLAVKPQSMDSVLSMAAKIAGPNTLVISIAAGTSIAQIKQAFGATAPVVRVMPNTPAAIGQGISGGFASPEVTPNQSALAQAMMQAIGDFLWLDTEEAMHAVTAISGSGPAYVFYMIEALTQAGTALGLDATTAEKLAMQTVAGSGALASKADEAPAQLRQNVTSPNGTTQAGLEVLMHAQDGLAPLMRRTTQAASDRSRALAQEG